MPNASSLALTHRVAVSLELMSTGGDQCAAEIPSKAAHSLTAGRPHIRSLKRMLTSSCACQVHLPHTPGLSLFEMLLLPRMLPSGDKSLRSACCVFAVASITTVGVIHQPSLAHVAATEERDHVALPLLGIGARCKRLSG